MPLPVLQTKRLSCDGCEQTLCYSIRCMLSRRGISRSNRWRAITKVPVQQGYGELHVENRRIRPVLQVVLEFRQTKRHYLVCGARKLGRMGWIRIVAERTDAEQRRCHRMGGQQRKGSLSCACFHRFKSAHIYLILFVQDRHTVGRSRPIVDSSQDWLLISGEEDFEGGVAFTTLEFARFFTTCDEYDRDIKVC